jgi:hypothetical protein
MWHKLCLKATKVNLSNMGNLNTEFVYLLHGLNAVRASIQRYKRGALPLGERNAPHRRRGLLQHTHTPPQQIGS